MDFSFTIKNEKKDNITMWRCTMRSKQVQCKAILCTKKVGEEFQLVSSTDHIHEPDPDALIGIRADSAAGAVLTDSAQNVIADTVGSVQAHT